MEFPTYLNDRVSPFHATRHLHPLSVYMEGITSDYEHIHIFNNVQSFIKNTKRF